MMQVQDDHLHLNRCPHCGANTPNLETFGATFRSHTDAFIKHRKDKYWRVFQCSRCKDFLLGFSICSIDEGPDRMYKLAQLYPNVYGSAHSYLDHLPKKARQYLVEAEETLNCPSACIMVACSAVDDMLKGRKVPDKNEHKKRVNLCGRIKMARDLKILSDDMAEWADHIRLEANDQRHADPNAGLPTVEDAKQVVEFTKMLAIILYELPAKVREGKNAANDILSLPTEQEQE